MSGPDRLQEEASLGHVRFPGLRTGEREMWRRSAAILAFLAIVTPEARADAVADFYKGKLIRVVVGFGSGGG